MDQYRALISYIQPYYGKVLLNFLCNVLVAMLTVFSIPLIIPFFTLLFDDDGGDPMVSLGDKTDFINDWYAVIIDYFGANNAVLVICAALVLVYFAKNLFRYISMIQLTTLKNSIVTDMRGMIYEKILGLPLSYYSEEKKGNIMSRFSSDVQEVDHSILSVLENFVKSPLILFGSIAYMLYLSPKLTGFVFIMLLFTVFIIGTISKTLKRNSHRLQGQIGALLSLLEETLGGMKIVKGFHAEKYLGSHFKEENVEFKILADKVGKRRDLSSPLSEVLSVIVIAMIMWYGSTLVLQDALGPAEFFSFLLAFFYILEPAKSLSAAYYNLQKGMAAAERVTDFLNLPNLIKEPDISVEKLVLEDKISFENVSFKYPGSEEWVLKDISFSIPKGKTVALVGSSGAGKSTIADLIPRFYDVTAGAIKIDEHDIRSYNTRILRGSMGLVTQDPTLFNDTIAKNIIFGAEGKTIEEVIAASKIAFAHDFISSLPDGYETIIGDRGVKLSGGQRQRITIARAVLKDPEILILDEATSALDTESEKWVQKALMEIMKNRTSIVIAHRLSTIQDADLIYVLEKGRIVESGTHSELIEKGNIYYKFVNSQTF